MITVIHFVQLNLAGDGESLDLEIDLDEVPLSSPLPLKSSIQGVFLSNVLGPSPTPTGTAEVIGADSHVIKLTLSGPLVLFNGGNGYTINLALLLVPEVK